MNNNYTSVKTYEAVTSERHGTATTGFGHKLALSEQFYQ